MMADLSSFPITSKWPAADPGVLQYYGLPTPNGVKVSIMLEETGLPYEVHLVDFAKDDQKSPEFLSLNPNGKIPAIIDPDGPGGRPIGLFESGAILLYLADKTGKFIPADPAARWETIAWLMWQMGGLGPMMGQSNHFSHYAPEKLPYAMKRYTDEVHRLFGVLNRQLEGRDFVADEYSIADMAMIGWARGYERHGIELSEFPNVKRWLDTMLARPAVARGLEIGAEKRSNVADDKDASKVLFGQRAR
jgi:GST-like protein